MSKKLIVVGVLAVSCGAVGAYYYHTVSQDKTVDVNLTASPVKVKTAPVHTVNLDEQGRALHGYDPVAYFEKESPILGNDKTTLSWNNATWQFSNEENLARFKQNPEQFKPANGGFCTFGVVLGKKFDGDPKVWMVKDKQLYVFLNKEVRDKFLQDEEGNMKKANTNWPDIKEKSPEELEDE